MARLTAATTPTRSSSPRLKNRTSIGVEESGSPVEGVAEAMKIGNKKMKIVKDDDHTSASNIESPEEMAVDGLGNQFSTSPRRDKGKGRAMDVVEERPFEFMELPAELRLEIYRMCLTRPYKVLLSRAVEAPLPSEQSEQPWQSEAADDLEDEPVTVRPPLTQAQIDTMTATLNQMRAARGLPPRTMPRRGQLAAAHPSNLSQLLAARRQLAQAARTAQSSGTPLPPPQLASAASSASSSLLSNTQVQGAIQLAQAGRRTIPRRLPRASRKPATNSGNPSKPKNPDPLIINILRTNKTIYKEARSILYSENTFDLCISTAVSSLAALHQRSRRLIRYVELEIPSYTEIQDNFSEVVRLSLRYCSGLRKLTIHTPFCLPGGEGGATPNSSSSNVHIWAQGFEILRWLPQSCEVELKGVRNVEIEAVVSRHLHLAKTLSPVAYAHRQLIPSDSASLP